MIGSRPVPRCDRDSVVLLGETDRVGADDDVDAFGFEDVLDRGGDVLVLPGGQPRTLLDDGDLGAEPAVHLGELQRDVAAADDHQMLWHDVEFEDPDVGQVVDVGEARHVRARPPGRRR